MGARDGAVTGLTAALPFVVMGAIAVGLLVLVALVLAKTTVYTITNRRVAMRIGAALTVTLNIPFTQLGSADLGIRKDGSGSIYLSLLGETRLSYLVCWPACAALAAQPDPTCSPLASGCESGGGDPWRGGQNPGR